MTMDRYCVMGNPIEHSRSPGIHARFAELTGQSIDYTRQLVPLDGFAQAVQALRESPEARGCNVTVPFKFDAAAVADHVSERAQLAQAVNFLHFKDDGIHGDNTDGIGLVHDVTAHAGLDLQGRDVLLLGAGGGSSGALGPLLASGVRRVVVANRTLAKAITLVRRHAAFALGHHVDLEAQSLDAVRGSFDLVVNATASSLSGGGVPVAPGVLGSGTLALDMMYGPAAAGFMAWAREHGATPRDGLGMLIEQACEAFFLWRGVRPPAAQVLAELRAIVG